MICYVSRKVCRRDETDYVNFKEIKRGDKGFTLVEMLVTMVILGILLGLSVRGLLGWQDWSRFNRENEYAQTLFVAAQNQLSEYDANGTLSKLADRLETANGDYKYVVDISSENAATRLLDSSGNGYTPTGVWSESEGVADAANYQDSICYVMAYEGDYALYKEGAECASDTAGLLFMLLDDYVYDKEILNHSICVEFSPASGQIFAVSYSDNATSFEYNNQNTNTTGVLNIANRTESFRRSRFIGYYGVDSLTLATSNSRKKPKLTDVKLNNEETLNLSFNVSKVPEAKQVMTYEVNLYDADTDENLLKITLDGRKLKTRLNSNIVDFSGNTDYTGNEISCPVTVYSKDESGNVTEYTDDYNMLAWIDADGLVRLVLDAADLQATSELYESEADSILAFSDYEINRPDFSYTYSLHRFGISAEYVSCSVQGYSNEYRTTTKVDATGKCSPYFADTSSIAEESKEADGTVHTYKVFNYDISNARHLYNVRYEEDVSETTFKKMNKNIDTEYPEVNYRLTSDIDWAAFVDGMNLYNSKSYSQARGINFKNRYATGTWDGEGSGDNDVNIVNHTVSDCDFPSFKVLKTGDSFDGNDNTINGLSMSEILNAVSGIYGYSSDKSLTLGAKLADITENNAELNNKGFVALFIENDGSLTNLRLDNVVAAGTESAAAFAGRNNGEAMDNLIILNTNGESVISGEAYAGGIAVFNDSTITGCINTGSVISTNGAAGGIVAENAGKIENCRVYAKTVESVTEKDIGNNIGNNTENNGEPGSENVGENSTEFDFESDFESDIELDTEFDDDEKLTITAAENVGGIAAINDEDAEITLCRVSNLRLENYYEDYSETVASIGAFAGVNDGIISFYDTENDIENNTENPVFACVALTSSNNSNVGGVAGENTGIIQGADWRTQSVTTTPSTYIQCDIGFDGDDANIASLGGVSGVNTGIIRNVAVVADISGNMGSETTGCGGIAGVSGLYEKPDDATSPVVIEISNCTYNGNLTASGSSVEVICAGGIAGQNLYGSTISGCRIGALFDEEDITADSQETFINIYNTASAVKAYTQNDSNADRYDRKIYDYSTAYGHIGGIAGENTGTVISCDNYDVTGGSPLTGNVRIYAGAGCVGGIVGYNRDTGVVTGTVDTPLSTGKWDILCHSYANNDGCGGIVGFTASGENIQFAYNYASIVSIGTYNQDNVALGGIYGRIENATTTDMRIDHCANYGDISGAGIGVVTDYESGICENKYSGNVVCGGIVAFVKLRGIVINDCANYGNVGTRLADGSPAGNYTGGILASQEQNETDEIIIENCTNYGNVYSKNYAGGITSNANNGNSTYNAGTEMYISNCVNEGVIYTGNSKYTGGIIGASGKEDSARTVLYSVRNYGIAGNNAINGLAGSTEKNDAKLLLVANSLDLSGTDTPEGYPDETGADCVNIRDSYNKLYNYYINAKSNESVDTGAGAEKEQNTRLAVVRVQPKDERDGETYSIKLGEDEIITGLKMNPASSSYYSDVRAYEASKSSSYEDSRIRVCEDLDDKYMSYIYGLYTTSVKLPETTDISIDTASSNYHFTWEPVDGAYAYEVKYEIIRDADTDKETVAEKSIWYEKDADTGRYAETGTYIVTGRTFFDMPANADWVGQKVRFYVRAITGQYMEAKKTGAYKNNDADYLVSDWKLKTVDAIVPLNDYSSWMPESKNIDSTENETPDITEILAPSDQNDSSLSKVILDTPGEAESAGGNLSDLTQTLIGNTDMYYDAENDALTYEAVTDENGNKNENEGKVLQRRTISFAPVEYADAYVIRIADKNCQVTDGEIIAPETIIPEAMEAETATPTDMSEAEAIETEIIESESFEPEAIETETTDTGTTETETTESRTTEPAEDIYTLCIQKDEDNPDIYDVFASSNPDQNVGEYTENEIGIETGINIDSSTGTERACSILGYEDYIYIGQIDDGSGRLELAGCTGSLDDLAGISDIYSNRKINAALEMADGKFIITLPDVTGVYTDGSLNTDYVCCNTNAVELKALITDSEKKAEYEDSKCGVWYRDEKNQEAFKVR